MKDHLEDDLRYCTLPSRVTNNSRPHGPRPNEKTGFILVSMYRRATATDYCFGGNRDCGGEDCIGLDESWVESCVGCCAGFGSGVWTGLSAGGEDESF